MNIGILTFQPSLNYGGILQCLALKQTLEAMGHEVSVFWRSTPWFDSSVNGPYPQWGKRQWLRFFARSALGLGDFSSWLRYHRTRRFRAENLSVMSWKLRCWNDAPSNLDLDLIVVGSDMVWHSGDWGDPRPYLLEGAPNIPAIAYAASFGMPAIPKQINKGLFTGNDIPGRYRNDLLRFKAISCREAEGVRICKGLGLAATHVVDPTMLPDFVPPQRHDGNLLVCYLLTYSPSDLLAHVSRLESFAKRTGVRIQVFLREGVSLKLPTAPVPISPRPCMPSRGCRTY